MTWWVDALGIWNPLVGLVGCTELSGSDWEGSSERRVVAVLGTICSSLGNKYNWLPMNNELVIIQWWGCFTNNVNIETWSYFGTTLVEDGWKVQVTCGHPWRDCCRRLTRYGELRTIRMGRRNVAMDAASSLAPSSIAPCLPPCSFLSHRLVPSQSLNHSAVISLLFYPHNALRTFNLSNNFFYLQANPLQSSRLTALVCRASLLPCPLVSLVH